MAKGTFARVLVVGGMVAALACSRNTQDESTGAAPRDTVRSNGTVSDTAGNSSSRRDTLSGMRRDTTSGMPRDTTSSSAGQVNRDTLGYSGIERDTTGQGKMKSDSSSTGAAGASSTTGVSPTVTDTSMTPKTPTGDTTGYGNTKKKQPQR